MTTHIAAIDPLPILFHDKHLVVVGKPAGLLLHKSRIDHHEQYNLVDILSAQLGQSIYPVHRLDKPTSGLLIVALNSESARMLSTQFERHEVSKSYVAVARGFTPLHGCIDHQIGDKDRPLKPKTPATTYYRTLGKVELPYRVDRYPTTRYSLLLVQPVTGRRHQIRQHMKHIQHPLIGDTSYGKTPHNLLFKSVFNCQRLLLHASHLRFKHPNDGNTISISYLPTEHSSDGGQFANVLCDSRWQATAEALSTELLS